jgi:catechol 2,3-dioxygenase-like lactoylglutathione lyase family enzyme
VSNSHVKLPARDVEATASFLEKALGYTRVAEPTDSPAETACLSIHTGQQIQVVFVEGFTASPFDGDIGHITVFHPATQFAELKQQLERLGAQVFDPQHRSRVARFFFREPVNGYVFEAYAAIPHSPEQLKLIGCRCILW